jgi:hypothetical protein
MSYALDRINEILRIDGRITFRGDEVKCVLRDDDGGCDKAYLSDGDCDALGEAFIALAAELRSPQATAIGHDAPVADRMADRKDER